MIKYFFVICYSIWIINFSYTQNNYWQQAIDYEIIVDFDHNNHQFSGNEIIKYKNNSPEDLNKVFMHLYYNAFQPGSMMDVRSRNIEDPDSRVQDKISHLNNNEIGYHEIISIKNKKGKSLKYHVDGTILEIALDKTLKSGNSLFLEIEFESQAPLQIRRTGRDNKEGISYSMTQWYPKMCEYDLDGWHANPYIGREFYGVWGGFDVTISIDSEFILGGTGVLQNPQEIGYGYEDKSKPLKRSSKPKLDWHFKAENVHDFAWAADPDFLHDTTMLNNGTILHFLHQDDSLNKNWVELKPYAVKCFHYMNEHYGEYPYEQYSIIQGGDGGMEYPMCTLITAEGSFKGLVSVAVHESIHSWFQGILGTNESKHEWMDEGFCTYAQYEVLNYLYNFNMLNPLYRQYSNYIKFAHTDYQEPLSTHADFYKKNYVYGVSAYTKGSIFLLQLGYIVGDEVLKKGMKIYFDEWKFKHPKPLDFKRIMELESGLELDWYFEQFIQTINTIDYSIVDIEENEKTSIVNLKRIGDMPMPIDICIKTKEGKVIWYTIPLRIMRGNKTNDRIGQNVQVLPDWPWVYEDYGFEVDIPLNKIKSVQIDPSTRLADINPLNNVWNSID